MTKSVSQPYQAVHNPQVCVIGGGMAGLIAAISAARNGARTLLIHDRPVYGGNASSEVRMWICGAHGKHNKETGLLEEIQLDNLHRNPSLNYSIWDSILWAKARFQPNLDILLNTTCCDATMDGDRIASIKAWGLTTQTWHTVESEIFIDCSGDSILAAVTPAAHRWGREAASEFNEDIEPAVADTKTMGNSLLIQLHRMDEPQPYVAPSWAYKFDSPDDFPFRMNGVNGTNWWWIELGGLQDTIRENEDIRDELTKAAYGIWDYVKNRAPEREKATNWALHWLGNLPGKRENRRYEGDHILTQNCIEAEGKFEDTVAFGGWTMDDHHPAGLLYPGKPTQFHPAPSPYGIPLRSLYSRNVSNLMFAGRNISTTHAALSSTRVMATTSVIGQAAGTAAAVAVRHSATPRDVAKSHIKEVQQILMDDDCFLPGFTRQIDDLAQAATLASEGEGEHLLRDGMDRDRPDARHHYAGPLGKAIEYHWDHPVDIAGVRFTFDSNLDNNKRQPCAYPIKGDRDAMPDELVKAYRLEAMDDHGNWQPVYKEASNRHRLARHELGIRAKALRFIPEATWGLEEARLFAFEPLAKFENKIPNFPDSPRFAEVRAAVPAEDMADPVKSDGRDKPKGPSGHGA